MKKLMLFISIGSMVTFGLFAFMAFLISSDKVSLPPEQPTIIVEVMHQQEDSEPLDKPKVILTPPVTPPLIKTKSVQPEVIATNTVIGYEPPTIDVGDSIGGESILQGLPDADARPIVRVNPKYPAVAAQKGIEGWVLLAFDINPIGEVINVKVIESEPKRIFDKEAKKALKKWKYKARSVDGNTVGQTNLTVQLDFTMAQAI